MRRSTEAQPGNYIAEKKRRGGGGWMINLSKANFCSEWEHVEIQANPPFLPVPAGERGVAFTRGERACAAGAGGACCVGSCRGSFGARLCCFDLRVVSALDSDRERHPESGRRILRRGEVPATHPPHSPLRRFFVFIAHLCALNLALTFTRIYWLWFDWCAVETWSLAHQMPLTAKASCAPLRVCLFFNVTNCPYFKKKITFFFLYSRSDPIGSGQCAARRLLYTPTAATVALD